MIRKCNCALPTILLGLLFCPWMWGSFFLLGTNILLLIIFQQLVAVLMFSQEKIRPGADCGSDHELLIAKFRLKLKSVGKTTRPFRYDLNQIPYNYTVSE